MMNKHLLASALVAAVVVCGAGAARAQSAGQMAVKVGWNKIMPKVSSSDLSAPGIPGSQIGIASASSAIVSASYMYTDNTSVEMFFGLPYKHDIYGTGAISGTGKLGVVRQVSPTILFEYHLLEAAARARPYVGLGPTYTKFYKTEGSAALTGITNPGGSPTTFSSKSSWGATAALGVNFKIDQHWFLDAAVDKTFIKTKATMSTGQEADVRLNPVAINASIGYVF